MSDLSPEANRVRVRFGWLAVCNVAFSVFLIALGVVNAVSGFFGGWVYTALPLVLAVVSLRGASILWTARDRVAAGQDRLAKMDEPTRRAKKRRATRLAFLQLVVMGVIFITGAIVGGWLGFIVAMAAMLIVIELLSLAARLLRSRSS